MLERLKAMFRRSPPPPPPAPLPRLMEPQGVGQPAERSTAGPAEHWVPGPVQGDFVRHEGYLYQVSRRLGVTGEHTEFLPAARGVGKPPYREVTGNTVDFVHAGGGIAEYTKQVQDEVEDALDRHATNPAIVAWASVQEDNLARRFSTWRDPYWYLPGRVLERHLLRLPMKKE